jgi:arsenate reductase
VCDNAAGEVCPFYPGAPVKAHWSFPDPAAIEGADADKRAGFARIFADIRRSVELLTALPVDELDAATLARRVNEIGPH